MKTKLQLLMAELLLAAATTGWGQTTLQFSATGATHVIVGEPELRTLGPGVRESEPASDR